MPVAKLSVQDRPFDPSGRPAKDGGVNAVRDHEIAYIRLRDMNPAYIKALMAPSVMTIPANIEQGTEIRPRCRVHKLSRFVRKVVTHPREQNSQE